MRFDEKCVLKFVCALGVGWVAFAASADRVTVIDAENLDLEEVQRRAATAERITTSVPVEFGLGRTGEDLGGGAFRYAGDLETFLPSPESLGLDTYRLLGADWSVEYDVQGAGVFVRSNFQTLGPDPLTVPWGPFFEAEVAGGGSAPQFGSFESTVDRMSASVPPEDAYVVFIGFGPEFSGSLDESSIPTDDLAVLTGGYVDFLVPGDLGFFTSDEGAIMDLINASGTASITYYLDTTSGGGDGPGPNAIPTPTAAIAGLVGIGGLALRRREA